MLVVCTCLALALEQPEMLVVWLARIEVSVPT